MNASAGTGVFVFSLMSIPICYLFNSLVYNNSAEAFFFAGCATLIILVISARFMLKKKAPADPLFYGKYGIQIGPLFFLHMLYISVSVWACFRIFSQPSTQDVQLTSIQEAQRTSLLRRPLDLMFIIYLIPALAFCIFRGLVVLDCPSEWCQGYTQQYEPYLKDPSAYSKVQMLVSMLYSGPYYIITLYGLLVPGCEWMLDLTLVHSGALAQGFFEERKEETETTSSSPSQRMWYEESCHVRFPFKRDNLTCLLLHVADNLNICTVIGLENQASHTPEEEETNDENNDVAEEERKRLHDEWLERERLAQEEFRLWSERQEAAEKRKEDEERMIKEEWEAQQRREKEEKEQKQQEKRDRELDNGGPWMNPEAPVTESSENYGTERDLDNCPFFLKTGACRFGDRCSRKHAYPTASPTLMIRGMFVTFGMEQAQRDDYDIDACLEHSEEDLQESFIEFYHDVLPEFKSVGKVVQFKVSCNYEPHLRGNVYIQFDTEEQCKEAFIKFNGRWYAGRQLHCEICPVTRWKNAICGLFDRQKCSKGKHCNFLHVFRNPGNEFWEADRDLHMSPNRSIRGSHREGWHSERYGDRSWRQRHCSPPRSERSRSRREDDRRRSRSRERRTSQQPREDRWSLRSRYNERKRDRYRSRSRDRSRSRSRDRERDRLRNRSRDKDREQKYWSKSEEGDSKDKNTRREDRDGSRSTSRERNKKNRSPEKQDENEKNANDDIKKRHRSKKHSKKSKKKSKKKHKKKSHLPEGLSSSGESEKEKESDEETAKKHSTSPSHEIKETELLQKNCDLDGSTSVDGEKKCRPEVKNEKSNTEIPSELTGNDGVCVS
ncbi:hypothetical protein PAMP_000320 [Pampus punctatissimus]